MSGSIEADAGTAGTEDRRSTRWTLAGLALCTLLPSLGTSVANVALPTLTRAFGATFGEVQWVVLAYLLATTTSIVGVGRAGDLFGRRKLLLTGIVLFTVASAACGAAPTLPMLVAARALQGVGAAVVLALAMAMVTDVMPKSRTGRAMGLLGTMSAVGTALGPSLGGVLLAVSDWRVIFVVNVPLGLVALVLAWRALPADRVARGGEGARFDALGMLLLGLALSAYALAMTLGRGSFGAVNVALVLASVVFAWRFVRVESRVASPLVRLARVRDPRIAAGLAMTAIVSTVMMATLVIGPFHLAIALGLDAAGVGLAMSVGPIVAASSGVPAGRIVDRFGAGRATLTGLVGMAAACAALAVSPVALGVAGYVAPLVVLTAAYALFQAANNTAVMADVSAKEKGVVSGLLNLARNLGLVTGASVMGAVFALAAGTADFAAARADDVAFGTHVAFAVGAAALVAAVVVSTRTGVRGASTPHV